jgi:membrane protein DedA with SNARE-associated domain
MDDLAIYALIGLILVKEIGVPLPMPGDLLIIAAGAYFATDPPAAGLTLAAILVAGYVGASIQFFLFGTALRRPLLAGLERLGIGTARLEALSARIRSGGIKAVALTRMAPGVRIAVVPAAALATIPYVVFLTGIVIGNGVFVSAHFAAGFLFGAYAREVLRRVSDPAVVMVLVLIVLAIVGLVVLWRRNTRTKATDTYECWADCSCPACVAVVAMGPPSPTTAGP